MGFSTNIFLFIFLPFFFLFFGISDKKYRPYVLLFFSVVFYMWSVPKSICIIAASTVLNYFLGIFIRNAGKKFKKWILAAGVILNLGILVYFKYTNFLIDTVNRLCRSDIVLRDIIVPVGVSYFAFSAVSYLVDVYKEKVPPEKNFIKFALYMMMFQKITAGPIVRYADVAGQLDCRAVTLEKSAEGARRFCAGLAKKALIADQLGAVADEIFAQAPENNLVSVAWLGMICYTLQIYHDFSGYSDMAIGLGKMCGLDFKENFNYPYISRSLTEFWRRWHISLSSWFKDYLYIPLGGNRRGNVYVNLSIVFLATGLWHGSSWHFVAWGMWNGIFMVCERLGKKHTNINVPDFIRLPYTLLVAAMGWVLFRCDSLSLGLKYFMRLFGLGGANPGFSLAWYLSPKMVLILLAAVLACIPWKKYVKGRASSGTKVISDVVYVILLIVAIAVVMSSTYNSFIYFKF